MVSPLSHQQQKHHHGIAQLNNSWLAHQYPLHLGFQESLHRWVMFPSTGSSIPVALDILKCGPKLIKKDSSLLIPSENQKDSLFFQKAYSFL